MRIRKIVLTTFACLALGASASNVAQAAEGDGWTIGAAENQIAAGNQIPVGVHERIKCRRHGAGALFFTGNLLGLPVELSAEEIDCLEHAGALNAATIDNTTSKGHSEGALTFTNVRVLKPSTKCGVRNPGGVEGDITTQALTDEVIMDPTPGSTAVFDRFIPEVVGGPLFTIEFSGVECPLDGAAGAVKGSLCGESVHTNAAGNGYEPNVTGTLTKVQTLRFGAAQQTTGNSAAKPCALTLGPGAAQFEGAVDNELENGKPFGAD